MNEDRLVLSATRL